MARRRKDKIKYSYENYITTLSESEKAEYNSKYAELIVVMEESSSDKMIMDRAKAMDEENGSGLFAEAVRMKVYCIACQKVECDCCF